MMEKTISKTQKTRRDNAVQGTNDSSIVSKLSMSKIGYFTDEYLHYFVAKKSRRSPLINRGYYIRAKAVDYMLTSFLEKYKSNSKVQIISLGAGFDSSYFRLKSRKLLHNARYVEIDFPDVVKRKASLITQSEELSHLLGNQESSSMKEVAKKTDDYLLLGLDLTNLDGVTSSLEQHDVHQDLPTLILSEVVLTYVQYMSADNVISWAAKQFLKGVFVVYEQVQPYDGFGQVMINHFKKIGSPLRCISNYPRIDDQVQRYKSLGWHTSVALDMNYFYNQFLDKMEKARFEKLEPFDEYEEWHLKCSHYILLCAFTKVSLEMKEHLFSEGNSSSNKVASHLHSNIKGVKLESESEQHLSSETGLSTVLVAVKCVKTFHPDSSEWTKRFGHKIVALNDKHIVVTGGFGQCNKLHSRLKQVTVLGTVTRNVLNITISKNRTSCTKCHELVSCDDREHRHLTEVCTCSAVNSTCDNINKFDNSDSPFERLYHTFTHIPGNKLIVYGGRKSPVKACDDLNILDLKNIVGEEEVPSISGCTYQSIQTTGDKPCSRWRHSANLIQVKEHDYLFVYGGRNEQCLVMSDCYALNISTFIWHKVVCEGDVIGPLHSHSTAVHNNTIILSGGLSEYILPSSSLFTIAVKNSSEGLIAQIDKIGTKCDIKSRYSHTSAIIKECLVLVGGVSMEQPNPNITIVELNSGNVREIEIKMDGLVEPLLLHNHQMLVKSEMELVILGGGGNCFSFGTHLNDGQFSIQLQQEHFQF